MGLAASMLLITVGAVLTWAVTAEVSGLDGRVVGVVLLVAGVAGLLVSLRFWTSWGGPATFGRRRGAD